MLEDVLDLAGGGWGVAAAATLAVGLIAVRGGRPLLKRAIVGYLAVSNAVRGAAADVVEQAQDLYAETRAELAQSS